MSAEIKNSGFSLIEAMVAMMITGITFAGVYTLSAYSSTTLKNSTDRQKLQLIANEMLEVISSDETNIDNYNNMDFTTCNPPTGTQTADYHQNRYKWCRMLNDSIGTPATGDVRKITITGTSPKIAHIVLQSRKNNAQIVINNTYE